VSENNLPNADEKTEQNLLPPTQREGVELTSEAPRDTVPPAAMHHGWLEQFEAFGAEAFGRLEQVALQGLTVIESELLIELSVKLMKIAKSHDSHAGSKLIVKLTDEGFTFE
jgi:hypothetical protein